MGETVAVEMKERILAQRRRHTIRTRRGLTCTGCPELASSVTEGATKLKPRNMSMWPAVGGGTGESGGRGVKASCKGVARDEQQPSGARAPKHTCRSHFDKVAVKVAHVLEAVERGCKGRLDFLAVEFLWRAGEEERG